MKVSLVNFNRILIPLRSLKHSKKGHNALPSMGQHIPKVISNLPCRNDIIESSIEELPSGKILRALISEHEQFS